MKWLIPFSWEEVRVWDRIIVHYEWLPKQYAWRYEWDNADWIQYKCVVTSYAHFTVDERLYIDRRPRYKRLIYNLFWY